MNEKEVKHIKADMDKIAAVTNRHMTDSGKAFLEQIRYLCEMGISAIILREKDMTEKEYGNLSERVLDIADSYKTRVILHTYINVAEEINYRYIHLPIGSFRDNHSRLKDFSMVGVSTHTVEEGLEAEKLGADYITASHIYETDCKKGIKPKGLEYLSEVCRNVNIPVYALGGIGFSNMAEALGCGADKVCMMSELMKIKNINI